MTLENEKRTIPADVREDPALQEQFLVEVLSSLVQINSINPGVYEAEMARVVTEWLKPTGAEVAVVEFERGRPSVAAVYRGSGGEPTLVLNGHMDTHPLDDASLWTTDPFGAEVVDGYLYGRGACDMKAGLTTQIGVAHYLSKNRERLEGTLILQFAAGEERGEPGTESLCEAGFVGDFGIVTEPTQLRVATAERGATWIIIRIKGRSIHSSQSHLGVNPIWRLGPVLAELAEYEREVRSRPHPLLGGGTCTPGIVRGGIKENSVPDWCEIILDRRLLPGESADAEVEALRDRLARLKDRDSDFDFEISRYAAVFPPAEVDAGSDFAKCMLRSAAALAGRPAEPWGTPFSSDIGNLAEAGVETVTFGPGDVAECHCADERVSIAQVRDAAQAIAIVTRELLFSDTMEA